MTDNQDPMAALQDLLKQGKGAGSDNAEATAQAQAAQAAEAQAKEEAQAAIAKYQFLAEQQQEQDAAQIEAMRQKFSQEMAVSPAYQAAQTQKAAQAEQNFKENLEERSRKIIQLKRVD